MESRHLLPEINTAS